LKSVLQGGGFLGGGEGGRQKLHIVRFRAVLDARQDAGVFIDPNFISGLSVLGEICGLGCLPQAPPKLQSGQR
jgi:hypothetical protein